MKRTILYLLIHFCFFTVISYSQELSQGFRINSKSNTKESVFYSNSNSSNQEYFYNQYLVYSTKTGKDTLVVIDLNINRKSGTIDIRQTTKHPYDLSSKTISFRPLSRQFDTSNSKPIYCIKNYRCNDTTLTLSEVNLTILFSVADTNLGLIFLHQFSDPGGFNYYSLDKFRSSYLKPHITHARAYWAWFQKDSIERAKNAMIKKSEIEKERTKIKESKDSLIRFLIYRQKELPFKEMSAEPGPQELFEKRMDVILANNLFETYPIRLEIKGNYKICARSGKVIEILEEPSKKNNDNLFFIYFSRQLKVIDSAIVHMPLSPGKVNPNIDSAYAKLYSQHKARCEKVGLNPDIFKSLLSDSIKNEIRTYGGEIEVPTIYSYLFYYNSETTWQKWVKRGTTYKNLDNDSIIDNKRILNGFNSESPKAKNGKYRVRLNTSKMNDSIFGPNVDSVKRKYKFITHIGFNIGTFISSTNFAPGDNTYDLKLLYYNLFVIRHHIGLFGGYSPKIFLYDSTQSSYFEGGLYLAPGNYFYFKFGLAATQKNVSALAGISFIFPVFQFEGGYNFAVNQPYFMLGFNIPFNK